MVDFFPHDTVPLLHQWARLTKAVVLVAQGVTTG